MCLCKHFSTTKTPVKSPKSLLYQQIDRVSMETSLGLANFQQNFYASYVEYKEFDNNPSCKPKVLHKPKVLYCRYVDETFVVKNNFHELEQLQSEFEANSVQKYAFENDNQNKIPFLDTLITRSINSVSAVVYTKPTNTGECLNYNNISSTSYETGLLKFVYHSAAL